MLSSSFNFFQHKRILGHLASVYCVLFDRTGHVIATVGVFYVKLFQLYCNCLYSCILKGYVFHLRSIVKVELRVIHSTFFNNSHQCFL